MKHVELTNCITDVMTNENYVWGGNNLMYQFAEWCYCQYCGDEKPTVKSVNDKVTTITRNFIMAFDVPYIQISSDSAFRCKEVQKWYTAKIRAFKKSVKPSVRKDDAEFDVALMDNNWDEGINLVIACTISDRDDNGADVEFNVSINNILVSNHKMTFDTKALESKTYEEDVTNLIKKIYQEI